MAVAALCGVLAAPALAGSIYSWETEDGGIAFTDDAKSVPARYRDQVRVRPKQAIAGYARYTSQDRAGTERYAEQLAERVERLRAVNDRAASSAGTAAPNGGAVDLRLGAGNGPSMRIATDDGEEPIVVERVRVRGSGQIATRHDLVVRQGDRTLAIVRGNQTAETGGVFDVVDESDLLD